MYVVCYRIFESMCGEDQAYSNIDYEQSGEWKWPALCESTIIPVHKRNIMYIYTYVFTVGANDEGETIFSTMDSISTLSLQTGREEVCICMSNVDC